MEDYLLGVVPNELSPTTSDSRPSKRRRWRRGPTSCETWGRTRTKGMTSVPRTCARCYLGAGTEDPLATQAVTETRGVDRDFTGGQPINALYSSTCGGRTEEARRIFGGEASLIWFRPVCQVQASRAATIHIVASVPGSEDCGAHGRRCVLNFGTRGGSWDCLGRESRYLWSVIDAGQLLSGRSFYPARANHIRSLPSSRSKVPARLPGHTSRKELLFRLIEKKAAFEWQQGVLDSSWKWRPHDEV